MGLRASAVAFRTRGRTTLLAGLVALASVVSLAQAASANVTTIKFDPSRQGWRGDEGSLKPAASLQFDTPVSGQVYAQPLVYGNIVVVATENDWVYGINKATGAIIWSHQLGRPVPNTPDCFDEISPNYGVTATPVIDPTSGVVYLTARSLDNANNPIWKAWAYKVSTGELQTGWPITLGGTAVNDPTGPSFDPTTQNQRPGLLLLGGHVFAGFAGMCDLGAYKGWIATIDPSIPSASMWVDEKGSKVAGGIWQSGGGLASDGTSVFVATGNGSVPSPGPGTTAQDALGMSTLRLVPGSGGNFIQADRFTPYNALSLSSQDFDMGSGEPTLLPDGFGNVPNHPHLVVQPSKSSLYLLDRDNLGGMAQGPSGTDKVVDELADQVSLSQAAVWPGDGGYVYVTDVTATHCGCAGPLKAYQVINGKLTIAGATNDNFGFASGPPVVTSNGTMPGSATLWAVDRTTGQLRAYNPVPYHGHLVLLWSTSIGMTSKFAVPSTDGSNIFVGTSGPSTSPTAGHLLAFSAPLPPTPTAVVSSPQFGLNQTDVFSVASNGAVQVRWVQGAGNWNGPLAISPPGLAPPGAHLAVSNQFGLPNQTDVFVVDNNGASDVLWVQGAGNWNGPLGLTPTGLATKGSSLAASNQIGIANQTDVFMVDFARTAQVVWVNGSGPWNGPSAF